jgi:hypothetical protein
MHAVGEEQGVGDRRRAGAADVVAGNDGDCCGGGADVVVTSMRISSSIDSRLRSSWAEAPRAMTLRSVRATSVVERIAIRRSSVAAGAVRPSPAVYGRAGQSRQDR